MAFKIWVTLVMGPTCDEVPTAMTFVIQSVHHEPGRIRETVSNPGLCRNLCAAKNKKTDVVQCPKAFDHVGLLFNESPGGAELPFI